MNILIRNSDSEAIYLQIKNQIKKQIMNGSLSPGDKIPSIRELAKDLRISVITTKRAYDELILEGFINAVQGKGCFVAEQNKELIREEYLKKIETSLTEALDYAAAIGISTNELKSMLSILSEDA